MQFFYGHRGEMKLQAEENSAKKLKKRDHFCTVENFEKTVGRVSGD